MRSYPPISIDQPLLSIRRFSSARDSLDALTANNTLTTEMAAVLSLLVRCRLNILISGGTGSGKTTLLNALSWSISEHERLVTIEDAAELQLNQPHVLRLETRQANLRGEGLVTQRELVINALRMRPDRILLGEVRGPEAFDMLQAMNVGHDGSMTTLHANSPEESLGRLLNMVLMSDAALSESTILEQISSVIDLVVQIGRVSQGQRRILRVSTIAGIKGGQVIMHDLYRFHYTHSEGNSLGAHEKCQIPSPRWMSKVVAAKQLENFQAFHLIAEQTS